MVDLWLCIHCLNSITYIGILFGSILVVCGNHLIGCLLMCSRTGNVCVFILTFSFLILCLPVAPVILRRSAISVVTKFLLSFAVIVFIGSTALGRRLIVDLPVFFFLIKETHVPESGRLRHIYTGYLQGFLSDDMMLHRYVNLFTCFR